MTRLERRRKTRKYELKEGTKTFRQSLTSDRLGLTGSLDMLIESGGNFYPVEYKYSDGEPGLHHRYQLTAYALLVEEFTKRVVRSGYIYMLRAEQVFPVDLSEAKKQRVKGLMRDIRAMIATETMPEPTPHRERCHNCEFRLYCGDTV
jgi:CRISPR-associated exonuclease Cas4